jgi:hypothetical protein
MMNPSGVFVMVKRPGVGPEMLDAPLSEVFCRTEATSKASAGRSGADVCPDSSATLLTTTARIEATRIILVVPRSECYFRLGGSDNKIIDAPHWRITEPVRTSAVAP